MTEADIEETYRLAQQLLELIEKARHDGREAACETCEMDYLLGALDDIEELCRSIVERKE